MKITTNLEQLETLFNLELTTGAVPGLDFGKITVKYSDKPVQGKRYHTNILQRLINYIFGTTYQTVKTFDTRLVVITLTTPEHKQYTVCLDEDILYHMRDEELVNEIVKPSITKLKRAVMMDK